MKKTRLATLAVLSLLVVLTTDAESTYPDTTSFLSFLPAVDRETLLAKGELTSVGQRWSDLAFGRRAPFAAEISQGLTLAESTVAIEGLFLFPRPVGNVELGLYNAVNAVASMEGVQYFSISRNRMEPLILASWRVAGRDKAQKVADPTFTSIPAFQRAVIYQKDNKLGDGLSELTWKSLPNGVLVLTLKNLETLNYGLLPLVQPGNLQMLFVVTPLADKVAVYGVMAGRTAQLFGLERSRDDSFRNRMRALAGWLGQRIATLK